jgi:hypothetical protein
VLAPAREDTALATSCEPGSRVDPRIDRGSWSTPSTFLDHRRREQNRTVRARQVLGPIVDGPLRLIHASPE